MAGSDSKRVVVVGGVACGAKAASRLRRLKPHWDVTIIERSDTLSYAACGMPFFLEGAVPDFKELLSTPAGVIRDANFFRNVKGIQVLTNHLALEVDRAAKVVRAVDSSTGERKEIPYDKLVLATGASPVVPDLPGVDLAGVSPLWTPRNALEIRCALDSGNVSRAVVVGAGLVGLEAAEAMAKRGIKVTVVELLDRPLAALLDGEFGAALAKAIRSYGVEFVPCCRVMGFEGEGGSLRRVITDKGDFDAQLALVSVGVRPNSQLAADSGLEIGPTGGIKVDSHMMTSDPDVYAGGDCVETFNTVTGRPVRQPMGSTANRHGRVIADNLVGMGTCFNGVIGTAVMRFFNHTVGRTGLSEQAAREAGFDPVGVTVTDPDRPHFMAGSAPVVLRILADRNSRRVLGAQLIGTGQVDKRLDTLACAVYGGMTVDMLADMDHAYAPPFSSALDVLTHGANHLRNRLDGLVETVRPSEVAALVEQGAVLLDVRGPGEVEAQGQLPFDGILAIPLGQLDKRIQELPRGRKVIAYCKVSVRGWDAVSILRKHGFQDVAVLEGGVVGWPFNLRK
ncbi:pyridine nucleotide-disulphide oxidoreductase dimerization region [Thermanaerovibrio acidaminovorans DSM 6589]|uniref:Pyridine nucleotide-disulphide oxidoreductase dimerization region n=1 Tax=Thermanaerovibrio acidaminovorans (strain ATCC 49978 / DSM 6589 / Su883) TaxID=525903 RepID=D1B7U0_THEAS|nr:FAD-dependent oxidoreductase [Thermanaerovibrio acidaminovorans]ACZ18343.1 pyridine nucleotide-disulphide oxidoreductase dimerization region [Thermanaerovibrio acidaminovorans DSM 6589]